MKDQSMEQRTQLSEIVEQKLRDECALQYKQHSGKNYKKIVKEILSKNESKTFYKEIDEDVEGIKNIIENAESATAKKAEISRPTLAESSSNTQDQQQAEFDIQSATLEELGVGVLKRAMIIAGSGNMRITDNQGHSKDAVGNGLPVATYLSHGGRIMIEIPTAESDSMMNWLTSGDSTRSGIAQATDQIGALKQYQAEQSGGIVYERYGGTHDTIDVKDKDGKVRSVKEKKGFMIGAKDFVKNIFTNRRYTKHFGIDLKCGVSANNGVQQDFFGLPVSIPDGHHGHLYIHYRKSSREGHSTIMLGIEGGSPYSAKHSWIGAADPLGAMAQGSKKWADLEAAKQSAGEKEAANIIIPRKYNGMKIILDQPKTRAFFKISDSDYTAEILPYAMPCTDPETFEKRYSSKWTTQEMVHHNGSSEDRYAFQLDQSAGDLGASHQEDSFDEDRYVSRRKGTSHQEVVSHQEDEPKENPYKYKPPEDYNKIPPKEVNKPHKVRFYGLKKLLNLSLKIITLGRVAPFQREFDQYNKECKVYKFFLAQNDAYQLKENQQGTKSGTEKKAQAQKLQQNKVLHEQEHDDTSSLVNQANKTEWRGRIREDGLSARQQARR